MNKTCCTCKDFKPLFMYNRNASRSDGYQNVCRLCTTKYSRNYYRSHGKKMRKQVYASNVRRRKAHRARLNTYLGQHPCVDCGFGDIVALDFDHVRGVKKNCVVTLVRGAYSWAMIKAEIAKCEVRCANCHRIRHAKERTGS